jgi:predicted transcriptional regulator
MSVQITPAELEIMKIIWARPGLGASEIAEALTDQQDWTIKTIKTLLTRLVEKGALATTSEGRRFLYTPKIARKTYQKTAASQLVDRLFNGRAAPLVAQLADARGLSEEDIAELEALLGRLKS